MKTNCPFCQTENPDSAVYCKHCGKPMRGKLTCPACGAEVPDDGTFCIRCGARLVPEPAESTAPAEQKSEAWKKTLTKVGNFASSSHRLRRPLPSQKTTKLTVHAKKLRRPKIPAAAPRLMLENYFCERAALRRALFYIPYFVIPRTAPCTRASPRGALCPR